jgi:ketosteroid isomerase-like protein
MSDPLNPQQVVLHYLDFREKRDLVAAHALLAEGFEMVFPGPVKPASLEQLVAWARDRYRYVRKTFEHVDCMASAPGQAVVYCSGTLHGAWTDGTPFEGIRFIDRFEVQGLKIVHQSVWNDMALHLPGQS